MNTTKSLLFAAMTLLALASCQNGENTEKAADQTTAPMALMSTDSTVWDDSCGSDIPVDSANKMINSYIASLGANTNNESLYSLIIDAECLRNYLSNPNVKNVKLMFAHTLNYINTGHGNQNCGYKSGALTLVIAGYDASGNYVIKNGNVMDHAAPCPNTCPSSGTAASNTFPQ